MLSVYEERNYGTILIRYFEDSNKMKLVEVNDLDLKSSAFLSIKICLVHL